ncbi:hypothetical protein [Roseomonas chloroacetimidivorans]|uniref:hypothetical protein n=1 Tax=Roseomonas chloroacetimidivorans TaxID=1766656 RepID=UPI003C767297
MRSNRSRDLNPALDFEDDGASFRVRQERRQRASFPHGNALTREVGGRRWKGWFFWICVAPPLGLAGLVLGALLFLVIAG